MYINLKNTEELKFPKPSLSTRLARTVKSCLKKDILLDKLNYQSINKNPKKIKQVFEKLKAELYEHEHSNYNFLLDKVTNQFSERALNCLNSHLQEEIQDTYSIRETILESNPNLISQVKNLISKSIELKNGNPPTQQTNDTKFDFVADFHSIASDSVYLSTNSEQNSINNSNINPPEVASVMDMLDSLADEFAKNRKESPKKCRVTSKDQVSIDNNSHPFDESSIGKIQNAPKRIRVKIENMPYDSLHRSLDFQPSNSSQSSISKLTNPLDEASIKTPKFKEEEYFSAVSESKKYGTFHKLNDAQLNNRKQPSTSDFLYPSDEERSILSRH